MAIVTFARPTRCLPHTLSMKPKLALCGASMRCIPSRGLVLGRSGGGSTANALRRKASRWERSVVWGILRNPAYRGVACFGKTRLAARMQMRRPQRRRGATTPSNTTGHQSPRDEWIEIPVPALVTEETFAPQELLYHNKIRSRRRTIAPSVVQGLVGCAKCGYALSRVSTQTSARKLHYYKCIASDSWRKLGGPVCNNKRFIRQELLDQIVWDEVVRLLQDPGLIQQELDRRLTSSADFDFP
jgi:site-specific DNA recombinase